MAAMGTAPGATTGVVKWFNLTKGYGFIAPESGGKDIFVHISAVQRAGLRGLNEGQRVSFEVEEQPNGRSAAVSLSTVEEPTAGSAAPAMPFGGPCGRFGRSILRRDDDPVNSVAAGPAPASGARRRLRAIGLSALGFGL